MSERDEHQVLLAALDARDRELAEARAEAQREREWAEHLIATMEEMRAARVRTSAHVATLVHPAQAREREERARRVAIEETQRAIAGRLRAEGLRARELLQATRAHHYAHAARFVELLDPRTDLAPREAPSTDEGTAGG